MFRPRPNMISDAPARAPHSHPGQIGGDLDALSDHRRMHRVVVRIESDVVIAGQSGRVLPSGHRWHGRQLEHSGAVGIDAIGRGAAEGAFATAVRDR